MRILIHLHELLPNSESLMAALYYAKLFDKVHDWKRGCKRKCAKSERETDNIDGCIIYRKRQTRVEITTILG